MKIRIPSLHNSTKKVSSAIAIAIVICGILTSCGNTDFKLFKHSKPPASKPSDEEKKAQAEQSAALRKTAPLEGTIGAVASVEGMQTVMVQGYGLVAGLAGTGSGECPDQLRKELVATITRYEKMYSEKESSLSASAFLNSRDVAVVKVFGTIFPGGGKNDLFDLVVQALPNTGTTSLEGGRLYGCDLRLYTGALSANSGSRVYARGEGPIFINPFEKKKYHGKTLLRREGYILNGGKICEDRSLSLVLSQPSYGTARTIEQKINSLFAAPAENPLWQTAKATGPDRIELHIPREYRNQLGHFLGLIRNLSIRSDPSFTETMASQLARQVSDPMANGPAIALAWEAMGRTILPLIQPLYTSSNKQAVFYSAQAGARLGDTVAMEQLARIADDPTSTFRKSAVETLGFCRDQAARKALRNLLDGGDVDLRLGAYAGLVRQSDTSIVRRFIGEDNFILDVVKCKTMPMVYATRSRQCKIVLFADLKVEPPVFYCHPDDSITLSAKAGDKDVTLLRKTASGKSSGKVPGPFNLAALVTLLGSDAAVDKKTGGVYGLGLPYSHVVAIVHQLCNDGSISGKFKMQDLRESIEQPDDSVGRPEKD